MDEAQPSRFGFAMLRAVKVHLAFKLQDAAWKTQWSRWRFAWPRTAGSHQEKVIPRYQTYKMRLKQLLCRGQTEAYFPDHSLCCSCRRISWLRVEDADSWSSVDTFLHGSEQHFKRDVSPSSWSIGRSIDLPFLALQFGVRALWYSQQ